MDSASMGPSSLPATARSEAGRTHGGARAGSSFEGSTSWRLRAALLVACTAGFVLGVDGLFDEGYTSMIGDMPRYLMDGVYFRDLLFDRPFGGPSQFLEYTQLYYARYPALSLGHHPVLLPVLEAPLFAVFGISVSTARIVLLASLLISTALLQLLVNRQYGALAALATGLLFVSSPMIVWSARTVMSEMPALALLIAGAFFAWRFCSTQRTSAFIGFALTFGSSVYARPMTILAAPALTAMFLLLVPMRRLLRRDVLLTLVIATVLTAPALAIPLLLSSSNVGGVLGAGHAEGHTVQTLLRTALWPQLAWPVLIVAAFAAVRGLLMRDRFTIVLIVWVAGVVPALFFFGGSVDDGSRYTVYWVPALCALAASSLAGWRTRAVPAAILAVLAAGVGLQITHRNINRVDHASGYEEAARFVLASDPGATVMFSGDVDTGYFTFFVRKHDPERRLVVLRADKIFTTSLMSRESFEERIQRPAQIHEMLRRYGTRYVVIEDQPSQSRVVEWLREEVKSSRFVERRRIPIQGTDRRLKGTSLAVYEMLGHSGPEAGAVLSMHLPVIGQSLDIPLQDLIDRKLLEH
jgi:4-amino-4-deoxy-L-arabinose transferase-like glycosyltransferase